MAKFGEDLIEKIIKNRKRREIKKKEREKRLEEFKEKLSKIKFNKIAVVVDI
ncbi:hypothetical protein ABE096_22145 [Robertmurraya massiliosenegalensis]|uniref:hypothetical protein n=1 Tax=Robertmurraya TaxID=2837507 RepID=UPI0039A6434F